MIFPIAYCNYSIQGAFCCQCTVNGPTLKRVVSKWIFKRSADVELSCTVCDSCNKKFIDDPYVPINEHLTKDQLKERLIIIMNAEEQIWLL